MRTNVTFRHPAPFIPVSDMEDTLSVNGVDWFIRLLRRIDRLTVGSKLCQEDWGVVTFVERNGKRFWIGLSPWADADGAWLAHIHHYPFAWLQRLDPSSVRELKQLACDLHDTLAGTPRVSDIAWHRERDMTKSEPPASTTPHAA